MRVTVVFHGTLPDAGTIATGGALRAAVHIEALRHAGHEVRPLARAQDHPEGYTSPGHLRQLVQAGDPDLVICVAPEEAPALAQLAPLVVDLYAPRLLEGAFEGLQEEEAGRALQAVEAADQVLFSNPRQRWFWMGILGVAGWDLTVAPGLVVPLAALAGPPRRLPTRPRFVAGGHAWPWQDLAPTLATAVGLLGDRAEVHTYGLPPVDGVIAHGRVPRGEWLAACAGATAALDRYAPNPERALAMSFRQADYLGCGLPLISDADTPLGDAIRETGAGWVDEPLDEALSAAIASPRDTTVLAARYAPAQTEASLLAWQPTKRTRGWSWTHAGARAAVAEATARGDREARAAADRELATKRTEIEALNTQVRALAGSVEALSVAMADVAAFRRETVAVLGARTSSAEATTEHLRREVEVLTADLAKKTSELEAAQADRTRLGAWIERLRRTGPGRHEG